MLKNTSVYQEEETTKTNCVHHFQWACWERKKNGSNDSKRMDGNNNDDNDDNKIKAKKTQNKAVIPIITSTATRNVITWNSREFNVKTLILLKSNAVR